MRTKRFADDVFSHLALTLIGVLSPLILTPLYIRDFGEKDYSRISIIFSLCAFVLVSDYGVHQAASAQLVKTFRAYNYFSINIWKQYSKIVIKTFIGIFITLFLYFIYLKESNPNFWYGLKLAWIIYIIFTGSTAMNLLQHALLIKFQLKDNFGRGLRYLAFLRLIEIVLQGIVLYFEIELVFFAIVTLIFKLVSTLIFWVLANQCLDTEKLVSLNEPSDKKISLIRDSVGKAIFNFTNLLSLHGTILIASLWITPNLLFTILIARMIASPFRLLADSVIHGGLPRLTVYFQRVNNLHLHNAFGLNRFKLILAGYSSLFLLIVSTLLMGPLLWKYFSYGNEEYPNMLILAFIFSTFLGSISAVIAMLGIARSQSDRIQYFFLVSTLISLGLQFMLRNLLGVYAVPLSLAIGDLIFILTILIRAVNRGVTN